MTNVHGKPKRPHGSIVAVGGGEEKFDKPEILERFVAEAGGADARIAILPTASAIAAERADFYSQVFTQIGAGAATPLPIISREDAQRPEHLAAIDEATGIFMTGGDQSRLVAILAGTPALDAIQKNLVAGGALAGTSAGASAFSATMIVGGEGGLRLRRDAVDLAPGLGVITRLIIDQHFSQRKRLGRLLTAVAIEPTKLGVGIDEDTAIVYYGSGEIEVIGSGQVFVVDGSKAVAHGLSETDPAATFSLQGALLHVLTAGDRFDVEKRRPIAAN
ncbi:MAG TPA: cyanophycinase [Thermoanaerobaculia bacterium]